MTNKKEIPTNVYIFDNGMISCRDQNGNQIPELQHSFISRWLEEAENKGYDLSQIKSFKIAGSDVIPIKIEGGWNYKLE